jgi:hypothetical protein
MVFHVARVAEWQTRWIQVPVPARAWGFNSPLAHNGAPTEVGGASDGYNSVVITRVIAAEFLRVASAAAEPVERRNHQRVAGPQIVQRLPQLLAPV